MPAFRTALATRQVLPAANRAAGRIPLEFLRIVIAGERAPTAPAAANRQPPPGGLPYGGLAEPGTEERTLAEWRLRLSYVVLETLGRLRISEMFDIVVEHPESLPAVRDLAACLRHTNVQVGRCRCLVRFVGKKWPPVYRRRRRMGGIKGWPKCVCLK